MNNVNTHALFSSLDELVNTRNQYVKWASDGFNSSMPEDDDDNLVDPSEGSFSAEMERDLASAPTNISNVNTLPDVSPNADGQKQNRVSTIDMDESDEGDHDYSFGHQDPGTSMPADATNEKCGSYTFEQNYAAFRKLANSFMSGAVSVDQVEKTASAYAPQYAANRDYERVIKLASVMDKAQADANLFSGVAGYAFNKLAEGEDVTPEDAEAIVASCADGGPCEIAEDAPIVPEEEMDPETQAVVEEIIRAVEAGEVSPEEVDQLLTEAEAEDAEVKEASYHLCAAYENAIKTAQYHLGQIPEQDAAALARLPFYKLAELADEISAEEALAGVSPEDAAVMNSMTPEELDALMTIAEGIESGEIDPAALEATLGAEEEGIPIETEITDPEASADDEALNELSSAMMEQGVSPEDLESEAVPEEKQAELRKLASYVRSYRQSGKFHYATPQTKKAAAVRKMCHEFLNECIG